MKRFVSFILVIMISLSLFSVVSATEVFTLHNGVQFGMDRETVIKTEAAKGVSFEEGSKTYVWPKIDSITTSEDVSVAGQADSSIYYVFDNDKLTTGIYYYNSFMSRFTGNRDIGFDTILSALEKKYGEPIAVNGDYIDIGKGFDALDQYFHMQDSGYYDNVRVSERLYQWLYPIEDGYVDIMLLELSSSSDTRIISYTFRTTEEYQKIENEVESIQQQMVDDL